MKRTLHVDLIPAMQRFQVLARSLVTSQAIGEYRSLFRGKGLEFADYREYTPADDASLIDWKATARANKTLVKEYIEERDTRIFIAIDASNTMIFGSTAKLKNEYAAELAGSLSHAILEAGDDVGIGLFADRPVAIVRPAKGAQQFYKISRIIINAEYYGGKFVLGEIEKFAINTLLRDSVLIIVSDFLGMEKTWPSSIEKLAVRFDVIGVLLRDPRDRELPDQQLQVAITDPNSQEKMVIEPRLLRQRYAEIARQQEQEIKAVFARNNTGFVSLSTDSSFVKPITEFFRRRRMRAK